MQGRIISRQGTQDFKAATGHGKSCKAKKSWIGWLALLALTVVQLCQADALLDSWREMIPRGKDLGGIAYGNGKFVALGGGGELLIATNSSSWQRLVAPTPWLVTDVTFGNGIFLAVGTVNNQTGAVLRSTDGINWTSNSIGAGRLSACAFGNGRFVTVDNLKLFSSSDGIQWVSNSLPVFQVLNGVEFVNDRFIALGATGFTLTSLDGINWSTATNDAIPSITACVHGNGTTVMVSYQGAIKAITSTNAIMAIPNSSVAFSDVAYGNGRFVAVGSIYGPLGAIYTSTNGLNWNTPINGEAFTANRVTFANEEFVAVGMSGDVLSSKDGLNWTVQCGGVPAPLNSVAALGDRVVAVGGTFGPLVPTALGSTNLESWQIQPSIFQGYPNRVINAESRLLAITTLGYISTSTDGIAWTNRASAISGWMNDLIHAQGIYLAVGLQGSIEHSSDGVNWINRSVDSTKAFYGVAHGSGHFIAVGNPGVISSSSNGVHWASEITGTSNWLRSVAFGSNTFVSVGDSGIILRSTNGHTWASQASPITNALFCVRHLANRFIAVGAGGIILSSPDGITWETHLSPVTETLHDIALAQNRLWIVGDSGTTLISQHDVFPILESLEWKPDLGCEIGLPTNLGRSIRVQFSTDLATWQDVQDFEASNTNRLFLDSSSVHQPVRYYRIVTD
jgi:hypothetical protein